MKVKVDPLKVSDYYQAEDFILDKEYVVLEVGGNHYRLFSMEGPCLYPKEMFVVTDSTIPINWITESYTTSSGDVFFLSTPAEFDLPGFFEDYFDNKIDAIRIFNAYIEKLGLQPELIVTEEGKLKRIKRTK